MKIWKDDGTKKGRGRGKSRRRNRNQTLPGDEKDNGQTTGPGTDCVVAGRKKMRNACLSICPRAKKVGESPVFIIFVRRAKRGRRKVAGK